MESFSKLIKAIDEGLNDLVRINKNLDELDTILKTLDPVIKNINTVETALQQQITDVTDKTSAIKFIRKLVSERVPRK